MSLNHAVVKKILQDLKLISPTLQVAHVLFMSFDYDAEFNNYKTRTINADSNELITFYVPEILNEIVEVKLIGFPSAGAAGVDRDIDLSLQMCKPNELFNARTSADTTTLYDLSNQANKHTEIDLLPLLTNAQAGDIVGMDINHNEIGGEIEYLGIQFRYN